MTPHEFWQQNLVKPLGLTMSWPPCPAGDAVEAARDRRDEQRCGLGQGGGWASFRSLVSAIKD